MGKHLTVAAILVVTLQLIRGVLSGPQCRNPKKPLGSTYTEGCMKYSCDRKGNRASWQESFDLNTCCSYMRTGYMIGETITTTSTEDRCNTVRLFCAESGGVPEIKVGVENNCSKPVTADMLNITNGKIDITNIKMDNYFEKMKSLVYIAMNKTGPPFTIELRNGPDHFQGDLFVNSMPICDDHWDMRDGQVACRMLGFSSAYKVSIGSSWSGNVHHNFLLDDVHCAGTEQSLFDCNHTVKEDCKGSEAAGVSCYSIELRNGANHKEGNVFINNRAVCDDYWNILGARVVCRMLGFASARNFTMTSHFGQVPDKFIFDDVRCSGHEESLFDCSTVYDPWSLVDDCGSSEGAGVVCADYTIEMRDGNDHTDGNLFVNNFPVCGDDWDLSAAHVACKMLGFSHAISYGTTSSSVVAHPTFIFTALNCNGREDSLFDCTNNSDGECHGGHTATLVCYDPFSTTT